MRQTDDKNLTTEDANEFELKVTRVKTLRTNVRGGASTVTFLNLCTSGSRMTLSRVTCIDDHGD